MSHMNTTNISTKSFEHHGKSSRTSKFPSSGLEKFLRIVGNVNGKRTEVETGMNLSCRSIGWRKQSYMSHSSNSCQGVSLPLNPYFYGASGGYLGYFDPVESISEV